VVLENCDVALAAVLRWEGASISPATSPDQMWLGGPGVDDEVDGVRCLGMPRAQSNGLPGQSLRA